MYFAFDPLVASVAAGKWVWAPIASTKPRPRRRILDPHPTPLNYGLVKISTEALQTED